MNKNSTSFKMKFLACLLLILICLSPASGFESRNDTLIIPVKHSVDLIATGQELTGSYSEFSLTPDWRFKHRPEDKYTHSPATHSLGDINGDGYDDVFVYAEGLQPNPFEYFPSYAYIYHGSETGLSEYPDMKIVWEGYPWFHDFKNIGDINNDGYNDVALAEGLSNRTSIYFGSAEGLSLEASLVIDFYEFVENSSAGLPFPVGDVNSDGIDDFILIDVFSEYIMLYYGENNFTSKDPDWISNPVQYQEDDSYFQILTGDFNADGHKDFAFRGDHMYIFFGSSEGFSKSPGLTVSSTDAITMLIGNLCDNCSKLPRYSAITGDYNGDGFQDILVANEIEKYDLENQKNHFSIVVYIYKGSAEGINFSEPALINTIIRTDNSEYRLYEPINHLNDINNDGYDDFAIQNVIYYGNIQADLSTKKEFPGYTLIQTAGDINRDSSEDIITFYGDLSGFYQVNKDIFYAPKSSPPSISCESLIEECYKGPNAVYTIPLLETKGDFKSIYNAVVGPNWYRFTPSIDASGFFNSDAIIEWNVIAYNNETFQCKTQFKLKSVPITNVSIKAGTAHSTGDPNTFYIGYGATDFRIEALPAGGGGPYTYLWSNGSTEKNPRISETVPGEYPYWVKMTNANGCTSSDSTIIKVENALCSSPLVDAVMSQYPMILQNPVLANLIKSNSKIAVCKDGQTLCFTKAVVDVRITRAGYSIGACTPGVIPAEAFMTDEMEEILRGDLKVIVAPNPSTHSFQLSVVSIYNAPVTIRIMDIAGRQVEVLNNVSSNQTVTVGHKLRAGTYIAEVISGRERKVVKLVKIQ